MRRLRRRRRRRRRRLRRERGEVHLRVRGHAPEQPAQVEQRGEPPVEVRQRHGARERFLRPARPDRSARFCLCLVCVLVLVRGGPEPASSTRIGVSCANVLDDSDRHGHRGPARAKQPPRRALRPCRVRRTRLRVRVCWERIAGAGAELEDARREGPARARRRGCERVGDGQRVGRGRECAREGADVRGGRCRRRGLVVWAEVWVKPVPVPVPVSVSVRRASFPLSFSFPPGHTSTHTLYLTFKHTPTAPLTQIRTRTHTRTTPRDRALRAHTRQRRHDGRRRRGRARAEGAAERRRRRGRVELFSFSFSVSVSFSCTFS